MQRIYCQFKMNIQPTVELISSRHSVKLKKGDSLRRRKGKEKKQSVIFACFCAQYHGKHSVLMQLSSSSSTATATALASSPSSTFSPASSASSASATTTTVCYHTICPFGGSSISNRTDWRGSANVNAVSQLRQLISLPGALAPQKAIARAGASFFVKTNTTHTRAYTTLHTHIHSLTYFLTYTHTHICKHFFATASTCNARFHFCTGACRVAAAQCSPHINTTVFFSKSVEALPAENNKCCQCGVCVFWWVYVGVVCLYVWVCLCVLSSLIMLIK